MLVLLAFQLQRPKSELNIEARSQFELVNFLLITESILGANWEKLRCYNVLCNVKLAEDVGPKSIGSPVEQ